MDRLPGSRLRGRLTRTTAGPRALFFLISRRRRMRTRTLLVLAAASLALLPACKKEIETIVEPAKMHAWTEVTQIPGSSKIIVQMVKAGNVLYLQEAGRLGTFVPQPTVAQRYFSAYGMSWSPLPYDLRDRLPLNAHFFLNRGQPGDSLPQAYPTAYPAPSDPLCEIHLRRLDPHAVRYVDDLKGPYFAFGAINRNDYSLFAYLTDQPRDNDLHLVLSKLSSAFVGSVVTAQSQTIRAPLDNPATYGGYVQIVAVDDYFLVCGINSGLFKVRQDGTIKKVYSSPSVALTTVYQDRGILYAVESDSRNGLLTSADEGETWQYRQGAPDFFQYSAYYAVGDSLVGITRGIETNSLFTLRWNGNQYRVRELKSEGLGKADFTDLVQLGDTVYLGTTSGLFKRPLRTFFERP